MKSRANTGAVNKENLYGDSVSPHREAETIAREEFKANRLLVLSGVGAREYYRSLGYGLDGAYVTREL